MGVKFKAGVEVGKDITLDKLREQGFKAFYLAVGASKGTKRSAAPATICPAYSPDLTSCARSTSARSLNRQERCGHRRR